MAEELGFYVIEQYPETPFFMCAVYTYFKNGELYEKQTFFNIEPLSRYLELQRANGFKFKEEIKQEHPMSKPFYEIKHDKLSDCYIVNVYDEHVQLKQSEPFYGKTSLPALDGFCRCLRSLGYTDPIVEQQKAI